MVLKAVTLISRQLTSHIRQDKGGSHYLNRNPWDAWVDPDVKKAMTENEFKALFKDHEEGSRFSIAINYADRTDHVISAKIIDGEVKLFDTQSGENVKSLDFSDIHDVKLWKTNELELSDRGKTACESR